MKYLRWTGLLAAAAVAASACVIEEDGDKDEKKDPEPQEVGFLDVELETCVRDHLGIYDTELLAGDLERVVNLDCQDRGITDLTGIQRLTSLATLSIWENQVVDLTPLSELTGLFELQLGNNAIADVTPLSSLLGLQRLGLSINYLADISPLAGLLELRYLTIDANQLWDIAPIAGLPNLQWLTVDHNPLGNTPVVDELRGRGVTVYNDYTEAPAAKQYPGLPGLGLDGLAGHELLGKATVAAERGSDGTLKLLADADGNRYSVIAEFGSKLFEERGTVYYRATRNNVAVGTWSDGDLQLCEGDYEDVCTLSLGAKAAPSELSPMARQSAPVFTAALTLKTSFPADTYRDGEPLPYGAFNDRLLPYVLSSPNQLDAGTCLFMATTGCMEILLNQHTPFESIAYGGDSDLSERYLMNSSDYVNGNDMRWVLTDLLYTYNIHGGSMLDRDYPFEAGCITESEQPVSCSDPDAKYITLYTNWENELPENWADMLVPTPRTERTSLFVDPLRDENSYWRVGIMDDGVIDRIKYSLRSQNAPVIIVYNHYLYWHADIIVGYDDSRSLGGCPMVESSMDYYREQGADLYANKIQARIDETGGCWDQGVFQVRDSIYDGGTEEGTYTYGGDAGFEEKYSKRIVERSYNWVRFLANHAYVIYRSK